MADDVEVISNPELVLLMEAQVPTTWLCVDMADDLQAFWCEGCQTVHMRLKLLDGLFGY